MGKKLAITGHRPMGLNKVMKYGDLEDESYLSYCDLINSLILDYAKEGFDHYITGGAIGVDMDFAESFIYLKDFFPILKNVKLEVAIPCDNQDAKYRERDKERYKTILNNADKITKVGTVYTFSCMQKRNMYMVDNSDKVLAFWNGEEKGGTWNTIQYARKIGKDIEIINLNKN